LNELDSALAFGDDFFEGGLHDTLIDGEPSIGESGGLDEQE
jgi:hypothetical protein